MSAPQPVAIVTGASSGIGLAAATSLVEAGFHVVGTSRTPTNSNPVEGITHLGLDVTSEESVRSLVDEVLDRFGRIDVLVNNAGIGATGAAEESSIIQTKAIFDVNVHGVIRMTNAVLPHMRAGGSGRVVNVSSVLGFVPAPFMAVYAATKHAIEGYSESLDHEVRDLGIRVILVEPGYTRTGFDTNSLEADSPLPVYAEQSEIARSVLAAAMQDSDDPSVVGKVIALAATDAKPKLRYPAGSTASRVSVLRRVVPSRAFDKQIRKLNRLAG
jgi:NAD(P)-dependent dehydrogenase (short-subunit alcohol dehydrogenase family)